MAAGSLPSRVTVAGRANGKHQHDRRMDKYLGGTVTRAYRAGELTSTSPHFHADIQSKELAAVPPEHR